MFFTDQRDETGEAVKSSVQLGLCSSSCLVVSELQQLLSLPFSSTSRRSIFKSSDEPPITTPQISLQTQSSISETCSKEPLLSLWIVSCLNRITSKRTLFVRSDSLGKFSREKRYIFREKKRKCSDWVCEWRGSLALSSSISLHLSQHKFKNTNFIFSVTRWLVLF